MVIREWEHVNLANEESTMLQFQNSLKNIKKLTIEWVQGKQNNAHTDQQAVEDYTDL